MSDKKVLENIFNNKLSSIQIMDDNLQQFWNTAFECVKQFQVIYNEKKDFRKSPILEQITQNLAESINKINLKQKEINQLKNDLEKSRTELKNIKAAQQILNQQLQDQSQMHTQKEQQSLKVLKKQDEEIQQLKNEILNFQKITQKHRGDIEYKPNIYDIIIDVSSLINIQYTPIKIYYPNRFCTKKYLKEIDECSVVSFQGLKNKGRTFLLNELNHDNFPSGFHHSTSGISVTVNNCDPNNTKVYLDSEGINKPGGRYKWYEDKDFNDYIKIKMENQEEYYYNKNEIQLKQKVLTRITENFLDLKSTEYILQQFLLEYSQTIIIVVGIITLEDEICDKDIIVVHNLKEYSFVPHVQEEISRNLYEFFPLDQQGIHLFDHDKEHYNCAFQDKRNEKIYHCILAKKGSPAGDYYNQFTYDFIRQKIQINQVKKSFNIVKDFYIFLNKNISDFVDIKYSCEQKKQQRIPRYEELLQFVEVDDERDEISLISDFTITTIKDNLLDNYDRKKNLLNYSIYQLDNIRTVEIELPGDIVLTKASLIKEDKYLFLIIQANKKTQWLEQDGIQELFNNRNLGQISQKIKVGKINENLILKNYFTCKKGVYMCSFQNIISEEINDLKKNIQGEIHLCADILQEQKKNINEQQDKLQESKDKQIQELYEKISTVNLKNMNQQQEIEKLKTQLSKVYEDTNKMLNSEFDQVMKQNLKKLQSDITNKEYSVYEEMILKFDKEYFQGQSEDCNQYDIKITLDTIQDLGKKFCKIQYFENDEKRRKDIESINKCSVIGFQGVKNTGKTFLLNLLNENKFYSAFDQSTLGISAKVDLKPNSNKIYMDSECVYKPSKFNWKEAYLKRNLRRDEDEDEFLNSMQEFLNSMQEQCQQNFFNIRAAEQLLQEFLLQSSEVIIIVVGLILSEEQQLISSIVDRRLPQIIIVVHNYKEFKDVKQIEYHIQHSLMYQFPLRMHSPDLKLNINGEYNNKAYIDRRYSNVTHLIFANNQSIAGNYYNKFSLEYIRQIIQLSTKQKQFCLSEKFIKFLNYYLPNYIEFQNHIKQGDILVRREVQSNEDIISLVDNLEIKKVKKNNINTFGKINDIKYSIVQYKENNKSYKKIDLELPGNVSLEQKYLMTSCDEKGRTILYFKGQKHKDQNPQQFEDVIYNEDKRILGEFNHKIIIAKADEQLIQVGNIVNNNNGVYSLIFELIND